jgi:hypothetical protein
MSDEYYEYSPECLEQIGNDEDRRIADEEMEKRIQNIETILKQLLKQVQELKK